jgi:Protein of unknown function (DUF4232)
MSPEGWRYLSRRLLGATCLEQPSKVVPIVAAFVAVLAVGCAGHPDRKAQPCRAEDLRPDADARRFGAFQPQAGAAVGGVVLQNQGSRPCVLRGRPVVELWPTYGQAQRLVHGRKPAPSPPVRTVLLLPGHSAVLGLSWANWCGRKIPSRLRIRLPGDGEIALRNPGAPPCLAPGRPAVIGVEPFARVPAA